jgi:hypothetical protein
MPAKFQVSLLSRVGGLKLELKLNSAHLKLEFGLSLAKSKIFGAKTFLLTRSGEGGWWRGLGSCWCSEESKSPYMVETIL